MIANNLMGHIIELVKSGESFSDIQIVDRQPVVWRRPDGWQATKYGVVSPEEMIPLLNTISKDWKTLFGMSQAINRTLNFEFGRLRCSAYTVNAARGYGVTLRVLPIDAPKLENLGLPAQVGQFASMPKGILLVGGATGSGKSTTMAAITHRINETRNAHVVTIESPIEIIHKRDKAVITQREVGHGLDVLTFAQGVIEALRQCPDVIVIGEIRDQETATAAMRAAVSGHYVMASLHSKSALGAIQQMLSFFPDDERSSRATALASTLCGVIYQSIMPSADNSTSVVAAELLTGIDGEVASAMTAATPERFKGLEEKFRKGELQGAIHLNSTLKQFMTSQKVTRKAALAATYHPEGLV